MSDAKKKKVGTAKIIFLRLSANKKRENVVGEKKYIPPASYATLRLLVIIFRPLKLCKRSDD
jgi:hypothetical protein